MSAPRFFTQSTPDSAACRQLMVAQPLNPFATYAYIEAERSLGAEPWLLGYEGNEEFIGCLAFIRSSRMSRTLTIPSAPNASPEFWDNVRTFCADQRVTNVEVNTFASPAGPIPQLGEEVSRLERFECVVPVQASPEDMLRKMRTNHRRNVRKAVNAGAELRTGEGCRLEDHVRLMSASMQRRRQRGEDIDCEPSAAALQPYLKTGFCRLFQVAAAKEVVSSIMVACSAEARYLYTSGTSPDGMDIGASHFLVYGIMQAGRDEGAMVFNLGGTSDLSSGLGQYKSGFGAEIIRLEAAEFYTGNTLHKAVSGSARLVKNVLSRARTLAGGDA
jgi:Acetyltransferase (GNAT) domain